MNTIFKFPVGPGRQSVSVHASCTVLSAHEQHGIPHVWILTNPILPRMVVTIDGIRTGDEIPNNPGKFIGTVLLNQGALVLHFFEVSRQVIV